jgi:oligoribonuclease NrnB/cAMP/cGMP phosphodiesterase (DHH superfamily)
MNKRYLKIENSKSKHIVYFHYPCIDGLSSAWVAKLALIKSDPNLQLIPRKHSDKVELNIENKIIYFLDTAPSIDIYKKLKEKNTVYILDHHKSNLVDYKDLKDENIYFDMNLSGVGLTWNFFFPNKEMPIFIQMIQGRDLFKFNLKNINELNEIINLEMLDRKEINNQLKIFDDLYKIKGKLDEYINLGVILVKQKELRVKKIGDKNIHNIYLYEGHKLCMINVDSDLSSDLGHYLTSKHECDFAILWSYDHINEVYILSMRSSDKVDVSVICKKFGGGGHPNASACKIDKHPLIIFGKNKKI